MHYFGNTRHTQSMIALWFQLSILEIPVENCIVGILLTCPIICKLSYKVKYPQPHECDCRLSTAPARNATSHWSQSVSDSLDKEEVESLFLHKTKLKKELPSMKNSYPVSLISYNVRPKDCWCRNYYRHFVIKQRDTFLGCDWPVFERVDQPYPVCRRYILEMKWMTD